MQVVDTGTYPLRINRSPPSDGVKGKESAPEWFNAIATAASSWHQSLSTPDSIRESPESTVSSGEYSVRRGHRQLYSVKIIGLEREGAAVSLVLGVGDEDASITSTEFRAGPIPGARRTAVNAVLVEAAHSLRDSRNFNAVLSELAPYVRAGLIQVSHPRHPLSQGDRNPPHNPPSSLWADTVQKLVAHRIPLLDWGSESSKPLSSLLGEIERGDCRLIENGNDLIRQVEVARVKVFYKTPEGQTLKLVEAGQYFSDGRVRERKSEYSIAEKIGDETAHAAAERAFQEELGLPSAPLLAGGSLSGCRGECSDYPGLLTEKVFTNFTAWLRPDQFRPEGYTEIQKDKRTEFRWVEVAAVQANQG